MYPLDSSLNWKMLFFNILISHIHMIKTLKNYCYYNSTVDADLNSYITNKIIKQKIEIKIKIPTNTHNILSQWSYDVS